MKAAYITSNCKNYIKHLKFKKKSNPAINFQNTIRSTRTHQKNAGTNCFYSSRFHSSSKEKLALNKTTAIEK
jgi:hypothetical protein